MSLAINPFAEFDLAALAQGLEAYFAKVLGVQSERVSVALTMGMVSPKGKSPGVGIQMLVRLDGKPLDQLSQTKLRGYLMTVAEYLGATSNRQAEVVEGDGLFPEAIPGASC